MSCLSPAFQLTLFPHSLPTHLFPTIPFHLLGPQFPYPVTSHMGPSSQAGFTFTWLCCDGLKQDSENVLWAINKNEQSWCMMVQQVKSLPLASSNPDSSPTSGAVCGVCSFSLDRMSFSHMLTFTTESGRNGLVN